ncbi:unnamed protein product [Penicillium salamii]|uniref:Uncharacterized protein n=1 Tax=Penicillium salamii TaxID=1612424 RepID=A0A9W4K3T6_9EURO|nr:unnamed protein product [Penicillium salamii]
MEPQASPVLSQEQIEHFMRHRFVRVPKCFSQQKADRMAGDVWERLGFSPTDKSTWTNEVTYMDETKITSIKPFAPRAWAAICQLLGGEDRVNRESANWNDAFVVNLGSPEFEGTWPSPAELTGWHVDGDFFVHFLDSPEQALLVIPLFTSIQERAGGTMVCSDAMKAIAQHLYDRVSPFMLPRGQEPDGNPFDTPFYSDIVQNCSEFHEMTGDVGDVILLHPLTCHSVAVNKPFNFDRDDPKQYSIVEKTTLELLGKDRLRGWKIKGKREFVVPEWEKRRR